MNAEDEAYFDAMARLYLQGVNSSESPVMLRDLGGVFGLAARDAERVRVNQGGMLGFIGWIRDASERSKVARQTWHAHERSMRRLAERQHWSAARTATQYISAHVARTGMPSLHELQSFGSRTMGELGSKPRWLYDIAEVREAFIAGLEVMTDTVPAIIAGTEQLRTGDWKSAIETGRSAQQLWRIVQDAAVPALQKRPTLGQSSLPPRAVPTQFERGTHSHGAGDRGVRLAITAPVRGLKPSPSPTPRPAFPASAQSPYTPTITLPPPVMPPVPSRIDEAVAHGVVFEPETGRDWRTVAPSDRARIVVDSQRQAYVLGSVLNRSFASPGVQPAQDLRGQRQAADDLVSRVERHWRAAVPPRQPSAEAAARNTYEALQRERPQNPTKFVRDRLFDNWRDRFVTRVLKDPSLVEALRREAGIYVRKEGTKFSVRSLNPNGTFAQVSLNIDHHGEGLAQAVGRAISTGSFVPLVKVVESANLTLIFGRENQVAIEALRTALGKMGQQTHTNEVLQAIQRWEIGQRESRR